MEAFLSSLHLLFSPVVQTRRERFALAGLNIFLEGQKPQCRHRNCILFIFYKGSELCFSSCVFKNFFFLQFIQCNFFCFDFSLCISYIDV